MVGAGGVAVVVVVPGAAFPGNSLKMANAPINTIVVKIVADRTRRYRRERLIDWRLVGRLS